MQAADLREGDEEGSCSDNEEPRVALYGENNSSGQDGAHHQPGQIRISKLHRR